MGVDEGGFLPRKVLEMAKIGYPVALGTDGEIDFELNGPLTCDALRAMVPGGRANTPVAAAAGRKTEGDTPHTAVVVIVSDIERDLEDLHERKEWVWNKRLVADGVPAGTTIHVLGKKGTFDGEEFGFTFRVAGEEVVKAA